MADPQAALTWGKRLDRFDRADMTVAQFCLDEGVSQSSFFHWRRRLRGQRPPAEQGHVQPMPRFLPVSLPSPSAQPAPPPTTLKSVMTVDLPGGIRVRFEIPADHQTADRSEARS